MKHLLIAALFIFSATLVFAQDNTDGEKVIKSIIQKQQEAWNKHDFTAFCSFYTNDATFVNYIGMFWKGRKEIADHLHSFTDCCLVFTSIKLDFKDVRFIAHDVAVVYSEETITVDKAYDIPDHHYKQGETEYKMIIQIFVRENNEWKITAQQLTAIDQFFSPHQNTK